MLITFPSIGYSTVLLSTLLRSWGVPFLEPRPTSEKAVELALKIAPEGACMPFKTVLGNFLQGYEDGADTGIFFGGCGPCSFGWFSTTMNELFRKSGIRFRVLTLEFHSDDLRELGAFLKESSKKSLPRLALSAPAGLAATWYLDWFEKRFLDIRATLDSPEERWKFDCLETKAYTRILHKDSFSALLFEMYRQMAVAEAFRRRGKEKVQIGIVGDIFSVIDGFSNQYVQRLLADMGIRTRRSMTLSGWFYGHVPLLPKPWKLGAARYMKRAVGGFARETVGYTALWARKMDGIIQIYPLNCMPETVASAILPRLHERNATAILQLSVDEGAGTEGLCTRVEAFSELVKRKKETAKGGMRYHRLFFGR